MDIDEQIKKQREYLDCANSAKMSTGPSTPYNACGSAGLSEPMRDNLQQRVASQTRRAQRESRKANKLSELQYLLDKYPDFARILTLLEEVDKY